jgi:hypothetical protein
VAVVEVELIFFVYDGFGVMLDGIDRDRGSCESRKLVDGRSWKRKDVEKGRRDELSSRRKERWLSDDKKVAIEMKQ